MTYRVPTSHSLRWIEYLPEVGESILDRVKWLWEAEMLVKAKRADLIADVKREWPLEERQRAIALAKACPGSKPHPSELQRVGTEG